MGGARLGLGRWSREPAASARTEHCFAPPRLGWVIRMSSRFPRAAKAGLWALAACAMTGVAVTAETALASRGPAHHATRATAAAQTAQPAQTARPAQPAQTAATAQTAASGDAPAGFVYGTDSTYMAIPGSKPYKTPVIGGTYGGYIGMVGNWANWQRCGGKVVWSASNAAAARTDLVTYHTGIGAGAYWFMAGPGVDPHYNGTYAESYAWGQAQAKAALAAIRAQTPRINYQIVFEDVELPGHAPSFTPAQDNGWKSAYTAPCSGRVSHTSIAAHVDRGDVNGFAAYLTANSRYKVGVYSAPSIWPAIFGTGADSRIPTLYEWTYNADTNSLSHAPYGWHLAGVPSVAAKFFGGQSSSTRYAVMWQWTGGGGTYNGYGDFNQIDVSRSP